MILNGCKYSSKIHIANCDHGEADDAISGKICASVSGKAEYSESAACP